jgi:glycosyltransferase involved in cell wall biosynthesis
MKHHNSLQIKLWAASILLGSCLVSCTLNSHLPTKPSTGTYPLVTFIIPTIGRPTLKAAITSLQKQKNKNWRAIVIFDGIKPTHVSTTDPRISCIEITKLGQLNHAGAVRNCGMEHVKTEWIAFLDDDDIVSDDYTDRLLEEIGLNSQVDVVIFRMYHPYRGNFIPRPQDKTFSEGNVGISFSMKTALYRAGFDFKPGGTEDFNLLNRLREEGCKMVLSPYITYWIREASNYSLPHSTSLCKRAYIN